ncbi:class I SAM-dependent methyltransferase [Salinarchaeum chitinilyticum]
MRASTRHSREWYDALSPYYDALVDPFQGRLRRRGIEHLDAAPGDVVLDVGCGTGRGLARFEATVGPEGHVIGIDVAAQMCQLTRDRLDETGPSEVICGDALSLPFAADSFDHVLVSFTLELFDADHRATLLKELRRVLEPGGQICVISPSTARSPIVAPLYTRLNDAFPRLVDSRPLDVSGVLRDAGFELRRGRIERVLVVPVELVVARRE